LDDAARLWEVEQIKQLKARYFRFLDTKQWQDYRSTFTDDAKIWLLGQGRPESDEPTYGSVDAFVEWMQTSHDEARVVSVHQGHMPEIEILDADRARGIWAMFDWVDRPQTRAFQGFGHYYEEYEKGSDARWRIKTMRLTRLRVDQMASTIESAPAYGHVPSFWPK
jgi:hypothetical protein